ncbi:MAG TPA: class I SAM-dependent methyltransferase [Nitrososphaeraceae archaeon]|nr:class I SAM-dependent methyltransferase [Nitrososphaeraceae archaeon]
MGPESNQNKDNKTVSKILEEIEETAKVDSLPSIGPIKARIVENVIKEHKPKKLLEIGTLHGYSAILTANAMSIYSFENKNFDSDASYSKPIVISVEKDEKLAAIARNNIKNSGLSKLIKVIDGDAIRVIPNLNTKFNMIFLDAAKNEYLRYLQLVEEYGLLDKRAVVVADNVILFENEMKDYLDYVRHSGKYQSHTTETSLEFSKNVSDALEVSISLVSS